MKRKLRVVRFPADVIVPAVDAFWGCKSLWEENSNVYCDFGDGLPPQELNCLPPQPGDYV